MNICNEINVPIRNISSYIAFELLLLKPFPFPSSSFDYLKTSYTVSLQKALYIPATNLFKYHSKNGITVISF